jgi:hypothetical protein
LECREGRPKKLRVERDQKLRASHRMRANHEIGKNPPWVTRRVSATPLRKFLKSHSRFSPVVSSEFKIDVDRRISKKCIQERRSSTRQREKF